MTLLDVWHRCVHVWYGCWCVNKGRGGGGSEKERKATSGWKYESNLMVCVCFVELRMDKIRFVRMMTIPVIIRTEDLVDLGTCEEGRGAVHEECRDVTGSRTSLSIMDGGECWRGYETRLGLPVNLSRRFQVVRTVLGTVWVWRTLRI